MTLPLELGGVQNPEIRRALEVLSQQFPVVAAGGGGGGGAPSGPAGGVLGGTYPNPGFAADMATQAELDTHTALTTTAHGGIVASTDPRLTDARAPSGVIAGDLAGSTWPTLNIASGAIVNADVNAAAGIAKTKLANLDIVNADVNAAAAIAEAKLSLATDAAAGTGSRRTLGTGALQAAAGNDARFTDARTPTAHQTTHQSGNTDPLTGNLDATARHSISKAGVLTGTRRGLNLIEGSNVTLTVADNAGSERVDVTIASSAAGGGAPSLVSSLPGSPTDGQEIYYLADSTNGAIWHLRYRSASASTFKWEVLGGSPLISEVDTSQATTTATTYQALGTAGPSITAPLAGDYLVSFGAMMYPGAANAFVYMSFDVGATAAVDADAAGIRGDSGGGGGSANVARHRRKTGLAAATALVAKYRPSTAVAVTIERRWMNLMPIRVG